MSKADVRPGGKYLPAALFNVERVTARGIERVASDVPLEAAQQAVRTLAGPGYCMRMVRTDRSKPYPAALPGRSHRVRPRIWPPLNERQRAEIMAEAEHD